MGRFGNFDAHCISVLCHLSMITSLLVDYNNSVFKNNFYLKHVSNFLKFIFNINISKQSKNKKII
jgi:hypothetical protein